RASAWHGRGRPRRSGSCRGLRVSRVSVLESWSPSPAAAAPRRIPRPAGQRAPGLRGHRTSVQSYDLIVLGSGPGGQRAAIQGAKSGKRVALVEKRQVVGGVCTNTGTIPSKTMREAVLHLSGYLYQNVYGINYRVKEKITMADLSFRVLHVIKTETDVIQAQLTRNGVDLVYGTAAFADPHRVRVQDGQGTTELEGTAIVIATG